MCRNNNFGVGRYSRLQKSYNMQAEQWKTIIDLPRMNLIILPALACPTSLHVQAQ